MATSIHLEDLFLEGFNNSEEQVVDIYTRLVSIMRGTIDDEASNKQNTNEKNEKIKIQDFAKSFAGNSATNNNSEKSIFYRSYTDKQIVDFIPLMTKVVLIKDAASRADYLLFTAYRLQKIWNGN